MYSSGQPSSQSSTDCGGCDDAATTSGFSSSQYAARAGSSQYKSQYSPGAYSSSSVFCNRTAATVMSVVGGAALGGVLMYLLDPEEGQHRRHYVSDLAGGAWETVRDTAAGLGAATASGAAYVGSGVASGTGRLGRGIRDSRLGRSVSRGTRNFRDETSDRMRYLYRGDERTTFVGSGFGEALAAVGMLAVGAGAMYFLDTRDGARRRNVFRDKFLSGFGRMCTSLDRLGRDTWNRVSGTAHNLKARRGEEFVDDHTIVERVRANMGHCVSVNLKHVDVTCINGRVTLRGSIPANEVDDLLKCAWSTRGVKEIINQLNTGETAGTNEGGTSTFSTGRVTPAPAPMGSTINCPSPT